MKTLARERFLTYDGIKLVSMYSDLKSVWCIPGRRLMTTDALVKMADERGVSLNLTELNRGTFTTTRLI